jgi:hypothetical protein
LSWLYVRQIIIPEFRYWTWDGIAFSIEVW